MVTDARYAKLLERAVTDTPDEAHGYRASDNRGCHDESHVGKGRLIEAVCTRYTRPAVLDVGCGTGRYFMYARRADPRLLVGLDYSRHMLHEAKAAVQDARADLLIRGSLLTLGFRPASFDVIYCMGVFGLWCPLDVAFLDTARRLLTPGGTIVLTTIQADPPGAHGWRGHLAIRLTPYLWGDLKRRLMVRLKMFTSSPQETKALVSRYFAHVAIDSWQSRRGRIDLHVVASAVAFGPTPIRLV
jgi:SAM-dependent methyltransferase